MKYLSSLNKEAETTNEHEYVHLVNSGFKALDPNNEMLMTGAHVAVTSSHAMLSTVLKHDNSKIVTGKREAKDFR
jgi:hypothetical protein